MMKKRRINGEGNVAMGFRKFLIALFLVAEISFAGICADADDGAHWKSGGPAVCAKTSRAALKACNKSAKETFWLDIGKCNNVAPEDKKECLADAENTLRASLTECREVFYARQEVCAAVEEGPYLPDGIPDGFEANPAGNDYFPLIPGTTYTYKTFPPSAVYPSETIVVAVKNETRVIEGVTCRVVQDTVYEGDGDDPNKKIEDTTDWYALHESGDLWYFGEIALNFEDGVVSNIDGSWTAAVEGAKPGVMMYADPAANIGVTYRQEFALGEAEDVAEIIEIVPDLPPLPTVDRLPEGVQGPYLHTLEFAALEPGVFEDKYYAPGIGNVLIVKQETGESEVLVSIDVDTAP